MTYIIKLHHFEWDESKRTLNLAKHSIDFVDAIKVFHDTNRIELETERNGEQRLQTIGMVEGMTIILVAYIDRNKKKRIISARRASKKEREAYHLAGEDNEKQN